MISVIIPFYNSETTLLRAVESVIRQGYEQKEIILVNDGSDDDSCRIAEKICENQDIKFISQSNKGVSSARNAGAKIAIGNWLVFLDSDDELEVDALMAFADAITDESNVIVGGMKLITDGVIKIKLPDQNKYLAKIPGTFCIKKSTFEAVKGYDEEFNFGENTELFHRIRLFPYNEILIKKVTVLYYNNPNGGSKNLRNMTDSNLLILDKHNETLSANMKHKYNQIIAVNKLRSRSYSESRKYFFKAIFYYPFNFRTYLRLLISFVPFFCKYVYK